MKRKLTVNARADLDVAEHYVYLLGRNADAAARFRQAVKDAYLRIRQDPWSCATMVLEHFEEIELRFCHPRGFDNYLILFQVTDEGPIVLRVLHGGQDVASALRSG